MNVSVLGLSGQESDRGAEGVGKSCLCNRAVRPNADDYQDQHLWLLSSYDFNSRAVNSDHFLYWGSASVGVAGSVYNVGLVEQTEFIHDETLRPFPAQQPYLKRAVATRLQSHDKLAYFAKYQLGFENDFATIPMPPQLTIDGFILCYDVSFSHRLQQDNQDQFLCKLAHELQKISKPFVIAVTKMDIADQDSLSHFYDVINSHRYLKNATVVELSAKLNVNVDYVFALVAALVLKPSSGNKQRVFRFAESFAKQTSNDQHLSESYQNCLQRDITNWVASWKTCETQIVRNPVYQAFVERFGSRTAYSVFEQHVSNVCSQAANVLVRQWLCDLPNVFGGLLTESNDLSECLEADSVLDDADLRKVYQLAIPKLRNHPRFDAYFQPNALFMAFASFPSVNGQPLLEMVRNDKRIPADIFESPQAFDVFKNTFRGLKKKKTTERLRRDLKKMLEGDLEYSPGMKYEESLSFVRTKYGQRFDELEELEQHRIFDELQRVLADNALLDLRNLVEQNCADIVSDCSTFLDVTLDKAERVLSTRTRYRRCDRLPQLRTQVLRDWLATAKTGDCRSCPAGLPSNCMANRLRQSLNLRPVLPPRRFGIMLIGTKRDATTVENAAKATWPDGIVKADIPITRSLQYSSPHQFRLDFVRLGESLPSPPGSEQQQVSSRSVQRADALIFLVSNEASLTATMESLQNSSISSLSTPRILCLLPSEAEDYFVQAKQLADANSAELVDCRFSVLNISQAITRIAQTATLQVSSSCSTRIPDVRIAFFCRCADFYSTDVITGPLLRGACCHLDPTDDQLPSCVSIVRQHLFLDSFRKTVQILMIPYHARAHPAVFHAVERVHGVILAFDPSSPHSFATMAAEANRRAGMPVFIVAVDESGTVDTLYSTEPSRTILNDAASLAEHLSAHFTKTNAEFASQPAAYTPFIRAAFEKREKTEQLLAMVQLNKRLTAAQGQNGNDISVNSLGRSRMSVKPSSSLNHLGLVLPNVPNESPSGGKEKVAKKNSPLEKPYQPTVELWPITEHQLDTSTGASLPILQLLKAIEALKGSSSLGIYRIPGSSLNSQQLLQQLRINRNQSDLDLTIYDVQTLATTLKAVLSRSCIINDDLASKLVELFSKDQPQSSEIVAALLNAQLPQSPHRQTLRLLFAHLADVTQRQPETMNAQNLARVFWPSLLQPLTKTIDALEQVTRLQNIAEQAIVFIIENWNQVLP